MGMGYTYKCENCGDEYCADCGGMPYLPMEEEIRQRALEGEFGEEIAAAVKGLGKRSFGTDGGMGLQF